MGTGAGSGVGAGDGYDDGAGTGAGTGAFSHKYIIVFLLKIFFFNIIIIEAW